MDELHEEIERRKAASMEPCVRCGGRGSYSREACTDCLGHGILLTGSEQKAIAALAATLEDFETDRILEQQYLD